MNTPAEDQLRRANRALHLVLTCYKTVARAADESDMLRQVCTTITNDHYALAWVGFPLNDDRRSIDIAANAGPASGYVHQISLSWDENDPGGQGPAGRAVRTHQPMIARRIAEESGFYWRKEASQFGLQSLAALPLLHQEQLIGILMVYSYHPDAFDQAEIDLLMELGGEVAYGLVALRARAEAQTAEQNRIESEVLRAQLAQQKQLNEMKSRFITTVSHELRTPLTTILTSSDLLKMYADRMDEDRRKEHLDRIQTSVRYMITLMDDFLAVEHFDEGMVRFEPEPVNIRALCVAVVQEQFLLSRTPREIRFEMADDVPDAEMDMRLMQQILRNLLNNALKYSPDPMPITLQVRAEGGWATFTVSDQGIGIPADEQTHLFDLFYRANNVGNVPGTGLGLSIVKAAVDLHGGTISFHSQVGVGSRFTVRLPLHPRR